MIDPLVPQRLRHVLPALGTTFDFAPSAVRVRARFFLRDSGVQFFAWEGQPDRGSDDYVMYGLETGPQYRHLAYITSFELAALRGPTGAQVERDAYFSKTVQDAPTLDEILRQENLGELADGMAASARERRASMAKAAIEHEWALDQASQGTVVLPTFVERDNASVADEKGDAVVNSQGQGLIEYALIISLVAVVVMVILALLGPQVGQLFAHVISSL